MHEDDIETIRQRIREDRQSGTNRCLKDYVDLFPQNETAVARAFADLDTATHGDPQDCDMMEVAHNASSLFVS